MAGKAVLPPGAHDYEAILDGIKRGEYSFAEALTYSGSRVPIVGLSPEQFEMLVSIVRRYRLSVALFGSRVAGPRTWQRTQHPVLAQRISFLHSTTRSQSLGFPAVHGVIIPKDAIKESGLRDTMTSDLSIAVMTNSEPMADLRPRAVEFEHEVNERLKPSFPIRAYLEIFGESFGDVGDFIRFGRERYIKQDLPKNHPFSDAEIEDTFRRLFVFLDRGSPQ
jgi:hypothetical protein